jgi:parvulin-like peptidyl-prolyl isomerase
MTGFEQSVASMLESLKLTRDQLEKARAQNIKDQKDLNQITADLYERIVELQRLEAERRRILEQKTDLEKQVAQLTNANGSASSGPVTQVPGQAKPTPTVAASTINGLITEMNGSLVTLSVGTADGVEKGMVFHITRGNEFLCDVVVTDADVNKCAGILEMIQQRPQVGDTAATKL